jgi:hypothetical protein
MRESASIGVEGIGYEAFFEWRDFDGDDCFRDFHIQLVIGTEAERFDFGDCAIGDFGGLSDSFGGNLTKRILGSDSRTFGLMTSRVSRMDSCFRFASRRRIDLKNSICGSPR